jgi:hypothetical protein
VGGAEDRRHVTPEVRRLEAEFAPAPWRVFVNHLAVSRCAEPQHAAGPREVHEIDPVGACDLDERRQEAGDVRSGRRQVPEDLVRTSR